MKVWSLKACVARVNDQEMAVTGFSIRARNEDGKSRNVDCRVEKYEL